MFRDNTFTALAARLARIPFALQQQRPFQPPQKALILYPCCISQVLLTTPLLAALYKAFPATRFDWAVSDWARPAIVGNPHITEFISCGKSNLHALNWRELREFIGQLKRHHYDSCFIPSSSSLLAYVAWQAGIPQRVGLNINGRGFAHTVAVRPEEGVDHATAVSLSLARAIGVSEQIIGEVNTVFELPDRDRTAVTRQLVEEVDWLGDVPLIVIHPGGGINPVRAKSLKRWPLERFALLGNYLVQKYQGQIILVGDESDRQITDAIAGLMTRNATNLAGRITLGEVGALCEVADLYVGNDAGATHVAAATGCPTLAIFGPSNPIYSQPYAPKGRVLALWHDEEGLEGERPFNWDIGVTVQAAQDAAEYLLTPAANETGGGLQDLLTKTT